MKTVFVITIHGADKRGRIETLVEALRQQGAAVLSSKVMRLDGQMSALCKVALAEKKKESFVAELSGKFCDLQFSYGPAITDNENTHHANRMNLVVDCTNHAGIQDEVYEVLERLMLKVESMECSRCRVAGLGETVFSARCAVIAPGHLDGEAVAGEIEALTAGARVNVV